MPSIIERGLKAAMRRGARQGLGEGSRLWMVVGAAAVTVRLLQRMAARKPVILRENLAPGQTIVISHLTEGP